MNIEKWKSQILRGTLEYCVLLLLRQTPRYGYEILQELNAYPFISSTESTIYPLLRRLEKEGCRNAGWICIVVRHWCCVKFLLVINWIGGYRMSRINYKLVIG